MLDGLRAGVLAIAQDGHICDANPGAAQILRLPIEKLRATRIDDVIAPLDRFLSQRARDDKQGRVELSVRLCDGSSAVLGCSLSEVEDDGRRGWVLLFQEISSIVELRAQHERLLQLAAVGETLPSVLHEIRNPLAAAISMLEVLVEEAEGSHQTDLHALLWELRRMVLTLQGIGGLGGDLRSKAHEAIDVAVREVGRIMRPTAEERGVAIQCDVPDMPLLPLRAPVVRGIVFNLVRNAIDACGSKGVVNISVSLAPDGHALAISVRDDGCGMSRDEIARSCDIFFTTKEHGSGIGLPICKRAVERAGGSLRIVSEKGEGTEVIIDVPIKAPKRVES